MSFLEGLFEGITKYIGELAGTALVGIIIWFMRSKIRLRLSDSDSDSGSGRSQKLATSAEVKLIEEQDDSWAQYLLGEKYEHEGDYTSAAFWYRKSAGQGEAAEQEYEDAVEALERLDKISVKTTTPEDKKAPSRAELLKLIQNFWLKSLLFYY